MISSMQLPEAFVRHTRDVMGDDRFERFVAALSCEPPVSVRLHPHRSDGTVVAGERVPWCPQGRYLSSRPAFTFDPLLHAGCYYVQEASSMFVDCVLRQWVGTAPVAMLDLCAAPGGKSTAARSVLPDGSVLVSNEPVRQRAQVLLENVVKWGYADHVVTNNYPHDFVQSRLVFDVILCDVPCSGEGMFRKDPQAVTEWSMQNVEKCWRLQREIVADAWQCLRPGGLLIYSTCTYNTKENEENVLWMTEELDAEVLPVDTLPEWGITGSLLPCFTAPVYRFIPGFTRGEGLFMAVLRKRGSSASRGGAKDRSMELRSLAQRLRVLASPVVGQAPVAAVPLSYQQAIAYLRGEALVLPPSTPRGIVDVCFSGHVLGQAKNIGNRANNLYPKEWRIKSTHVPETYCPIISGITTN